MGKVRAITGVGALLLFILAMNVVAIRRDAFTAAVLWPLAGAVVLGLLSLALALVDRAGKGAAERKTSSLGGVFASFTFLGICIVLYAFVSRWDQAWDLTEEGRVDLAPQTVQVLQGLTQDVTAYGLFNTDIPSDQRELEVAREKARLFLDKCAKLTPHLSVEFIDPQVERARLQALGMTYADPRGTVALKAGSRTRTIPLGGGKAQPRLEERDFTNTLINIMQEAQPKIGFLAGHGEADITRPEMKGLSQFLAGEGYVAESLAIRPGEGGIEGDYDLVVINGLNAEVGGDLTLDELAALDAFVMSGGRVMVLADPQFADVPGTPRKRILDWLQQRFGIVVGDDLIVSRVDDRLGRVSLMSDADATSVFRQVPVPDVDFAGCYEQSNPITRNFNKMIQLEAARSVTLADTLPDRVTGNVIARTLPYCFAETNLLALKQGAAPTLDPHEKSGSIGVAAAVTLQTEIPIGDSGQMKAARAVVVGDTDFIKGDSLVLGGHLNFIMNAIAWLTEREQLIAMRPTGKENQPIPLTPADETAIAWIAGMGVVQIVLIASLVVYFMRRRYA
ncbi:MAG: GldG family protein [Candidatus Hydrogenedentes bacterium]|nr:GldG family protein [Candidatus Hydrogenedentota bacterium]